MRALLAYKRGEPRVCAMVRAPTPYEEDPRRICRERKTLTAERVEHVNRIKGLLFAQGISDYEPLLRQRRARLEELRTGDGHMRNGTTTPFAALNVLDGTVIGRNMKRHRHQDFIRFLNDIDARVPKRKAIHVIVDNYATHKHRRSDNGSRNTRAGLSTSRQLPLPGSTPSRASSPNSPTSASNAACSDPSQSSNSPLSASSPKLTPTPSLFVRTARPSRILAAVKRGKQTLKSIL